MTREAFEEWLEAQFDNKTGWDIVKQPALPAAWIEEAWNYQQKEIDELRKIIESPEMKAALACKDILKKGGYFWAPKEPTEKMYKAWESYEYDPGDNMRFKEDSYLSFVGEYKAVMEAIDHEE